MMQSDVVDCSNDNEAVIATEPLDEYFDAKCLLLSLSFSSLGWSKHENNESEQTFGATRSGASERLNPVHPEKLMLTLTKHIEDGKG